MIKSELLSGYVVQLLTAVGNRKVNIRLMYNIRGFASQFPSELAKAVDSIFKSFDDHVSRNFDDEAIADMEKMLGLIEGMELASEKSSEVLDDELLPTFALTASDKAHVLKLCSDMRKIILATEEFDQAHRRRLLNRISGIEYQVEQPNGLLDVVRAGVSDIGETLGKFGKDIKPLTDRMGEVASIARKSSKQYDQIPAPEEVKQLPKPDEE